MKKPLPTAVLQLRNSFATHPERLRERAAEPPTNGPVADPPKTLTATQRRAYTELVERAPPNVLCMADSFLVEVAAVLLAELRADPAGMSAARLGRLQSALSSLGLSPVDRARVTTMKPQVPTGSFEF